MWRNLLNELHPCKQEELWRAVKRGDIDMVISDHSPCTADLKLLDKGDFMKAWGGISSVQFGMYLKCVILQYFMQKRVVCVSNFNLWLLHKYLYTIPSGHILYWIIVLFWLYFQDYRCFGQRDKTMASLWKTCVHSCVKTLPSLLGWTVERAVSRLEWMLTSCFGILTKSLWWEF